MSDLDLPKLIERFGSEDKCHAYLEDLRWPDGVECPRCQSKKISRIAKRRQFDCDECRYQFSVRVGTIFHDSKLPLWKWFLAVYIMGESRKGVSANQLKRMLGVSYKTAWYLCHRIRAAMVDDGADLLSGIVEVDETWHGGKRSGFGSGPYSAGNKVVVVGAVERGGQVRLRLTGGRDRFTLSRFLDDVVDDEARAIYTDDWTGYRGIKEIEGKHVTVSHKSKEWVRGDVHTNTAESVWSLFKRSVIGSYHQISVKHLPAYLDEFAFRFNNRGNEFLFRDTLLRLIDAKSLSYETLVGR